MASYLALNLEENLKEKKRKQELEAQDIFITDPELLNLNWVIQFDISCPQEE